MATLSFANAYAVNTATTPAGKEQNSLDFVYTSLGAPSIDDSTNSSQFSGNDVCAIGLNINGHTYYGWISRPIKVGGQIKGFYFWTDADFTSLAAAQADGNSDGDGNVSDNTGFILVVDQSYFDGLHIAPGGVGNVGSSSDRVDTALYQAKRSGRNRTRLVGEPVGRDDLDADLPDYVHVARALATWT